MKNKKALISIIIPAFNCEHTIGKCIESLLEQTYKNTQIIIVDDGSTDNTSEIINKLQKKSSNIYYFYQTNRGVSAARNLGMSKAKGEYIVFADSDDWLEKNYIESLYALISRKNVQLGITGWIKENPDGKIIEVCPSIRKRVDQTNCLKEVLSVQGCQGYPIGKIFETKIIFKNHLEFDENISMFEDVLFVSMYISHINSAYVNTVPTYHYVISSNGTRYTSIHAKTFDTKWLTEIESLKMLDKTIKNHEAGNIIKARIALSSVFYIKRMAECDYHDRQLLAQLKSNLKKYWIYPVLFKQGDTRWQLEVIIGRASVPLLLKLMRLPQI